MISVSMRWIGWIFIFFTSCGALADTLTVEESTNTSPKLSECNSNFHGVPIAPDAKYCQSFDGNQPVSFVYFSSKPVSDIVSFYRDTDSNYTVTTTVQSRIILTLADANHRLIVSQDNTGTQVDILVFN